MYHSREDFISEVVKIAKDTSVGDNEDQIIKGLQKDDVPELLQPDEGKGSGNRGEHEAVSTGAEKENAKNGTEEYLPNAFARFNESTKQTEKDLKALLNSWEGANPGKDKIGSSCLFAFSDELKKITDR